VWLHDVRLKKTPEFTLGRTLGGHRGGVNCVAFSNDGEWLASGSDDKTVKVWRTSDGTLVRTLEGHSNTVWSVAFSNDGEWLASGSADNTVKVWRTSGGSAVRSFALPSLAERMEFSPDGALLSIGCGDGSARVVSVSDGRIVLSMERVGRRVKEMRLSSDGMFAVVDEGGRLRVRSLKDSSFLWEGEAPSGGIGSAMDVLCAHPDLLSLHLRGGGPAASLASRLASGMMEYDRRVKRSVEAEAEAARQEAEWRRARGRVGDFGVQCVCGCWFGLVFGLLDREGVDCLIARVVLCIVLFFIVESGVGRWMDGWICPKLDGRMCLNGSWQWI
jgi:hypothetical protein